MLKSERAGGSGFFNVPSDRRCRQRLPGSDNSLEMCSFLAVSSLFDTAARSSLKFCLSSGLFEPLDSL